MREIITDLEKLSLIADDVDLRKENKEARDIVLELKKIIREKDLVALSAPQIGYDKRMFVINFKGDLRTFINPVAQYDGVLELGREKCDSIPGKEFLRLRHNKVQVMYQTPLGEAKSATFIGLAAKVFQEQLDHLNGLLLSDIGLEVDQDFFDATEEERQEVINAYLDALDLKQKHIMKEIEENPELKEIADAGNFLEKMDKGEIEVEFVKEENK